MPDTPDYFRGSNALQLVQSRGWKYDISDSIRIRLNDCPFCGQHSHAAFVMEIHGTASEQRGRDGLFICHRCGKQGNLRDLQEHLGIAITNAVVAGVGNAGKKVDDIIDFEAAHQALLEDEGAMDYLVNGRGFSREIIERQKLGLVTDKWFRDAGTCRAIVYPYLINGNCIWWHYRTLPTMPLSKNKVPKDFSSPTGWEATLYNNGVVRDGVKELNFVEGEANTIAMLDHGIEDVCGVPGAHFKKADWITSLDKIESLEKIYLCYDKDRAGQRAAEELASRIGVEKCWKVILPDFAFVDPETGEDKKGKDLNEWFVHGGGTPEAFQKLKEEATQFDVAGVASAKDAVQELQEIILGRGVTARYKSPWGSLNKLVGFDEGDVVDIVAPEKVGKGGRVTTPVLLPNGTWKQMGQLKVGDEIASVDGQPNFVTGVFPRGRMEMFKVTFWDGRSTDTTADHLWKIAGATPWERKEWRVYTTDAIANEYCYTGSRRRQQVYVPLVSGDFGNDESLPIDPWLLGALLGDGSMTGGTITFSSNDEHIVNKVRTTVKQYGCEVKFIDRCSYRINGSASLRNHLEKLGVYGHKAESKFIPKIYLAASKHSRWELLRGLMDTDGTAGNRQGTPSYCTISKQLADDVVYLVRSLGGIARVSAPQKKHFTYKGEYRTGQPAYIIVVRVPDPAQVFSLPRKLSRIKPRIHQARLTIKSIEPAGSDDAVCISVSHPSKLYITDDYIVTHNTTFGLNLLEHVVNAYGDDGIIICLEMTKDKLARKWVCHVTGLADNIPQTEEEAGQLKQLFLKAIPIALNKAANRPGNLYFCYPRYTTVEDIYNLIRDCHRRYGIKWVMIDNLQRLCDSTPHNRISRTEHLSQISKKLSQLAKDFNLQMVRILQPHRIKDGQMVTTDDVDGASQIAKDCDCMITLHRNRVGELSANDFESMGYIESNSAFDEKMLVTVGLSRYSAGGYVTLQYDGARSTVTEFDVAKIAAIKADANKGVGYESQLKSMGLAPTPQADIKPDTAAPTEAAITI
jgi:replicative DNA helicase